jgi:hypothetical protein|uniref:Uncharacterized protein n=1 Tax=Oryza nivara TaxID=4536 RepID=A0A0E0GXM1_ORYNI
MLGGHGFVKLPPLEDQLCFDADASAANGLAYYSAAAIRLLGGANGGVIGSDDDLWSFMQSAPPPPLPSAPSSRPTRRRPHPDPRSQPPPPSISAMASSMARLTSVEWSGGGVIHARENMKWRHEETALTGSGRKTRRSGMDPISQNCSGTQPISRVVMVFF